MTSNQGAKLAISIAAAGLLIAFLTFLFGEGIINDWPVESPLATTTNPVPPPSDVPENFVGTWSGTQFQFESSGQEAQYPTTMMISAGAIDDQVGQAEYPTFPCRFSLNLVDSGSASINIDASVERGDCIAPEFRFVIDGPDRLKYDFYYSGRHVGFGTLSRAGI